MTSTWPNMSSVSVSHSLLPTVALMEIPILELRNVSCSLNQSTYLFRDVSFTVNEGDIIVLQGRSGTGKSTLLKSIAHLNLHEGEKMLHGSTPQKYGIPAYRMRVMYVPQRPALLPGSPDMFIESIVQLGSHQNAHRGSDTKSTVNDVKARAHKIALGWDIDPDLWQRSWINLSGGEGQRMLLASALAFNVAELMLLDEPTSALDPETSALVEQTLVETVTSGQSTLKALLWITHAPDQSKRVGNRYLFMSGGTCVERADPSPSPYPPSLAASTGSQTSLLKPATIY